MLENPYFHRTPIKEKKFFFGRIAETRKVLNYVVKQQPVSVVGPRRIGKSSLLIYLCNPEVRSAHRLGDDYVFVYVDCQRFSKGLAKSDVYTELLELLQEAIEATPDGHSAQHGSQKPMTYLEFEKHVNEITAPGLQIVLLFDEFEAIAGNRQLGEDFFTELRGLGQTGKVVYVTASGETLYELSFHDKNILSSPFFNIFTTVELGFLKLDEAKALVDGLAAMTNFEGFDENDYAFLREIAGPHPFYRQVACYHLLEEKIKGAGSAAPDYDLVKRQFARELRPHFQYMWRHLSDDEQRSLILIGEDGLEEVSPEDMDGLKQKCLICQDGIFSSVFAEFVSREAKHALQFSPVDYLRAADRLGEDIERLGRREPQLEFSVWSRRLREAIRSEEEAIAQLNRLARRYLGRSFLEYASERDK